MRGAWGCLWGGWGWALGAKNGGIGFCGWWGMGWDWGGILGGHDGGFRDGYLRQRKRRGGKGCPKGALMSFDRMHAVDMTACIMPGCICHPHRALAGLRYVDFESQSNIPEEDCRLCNVLLFQFDPIECFLRPQMHHQILCCL